MSTVGVVGLGLIGGSFAKAYHEAGWTVLASNRTKSILDFAILSGDVDAELTKENGKYCVTLEGAKVELSPEKQARLEKKNVAPQKVTLGVRPENITLTEDANSVAGTVDVSEMMGSEVHLHLNAAGRDAVIIVPTMSLGENEAKYKAGSTLRFTFGGSVAHVFSRETERNLEY